MKIVSPENFKNYTDEIGRKAQNLVVLQNLGLNVPRFIAIPSSEIEDFSIDENLDDLIQLITDALPSDLYAVRSASLIEDSDDKSFAGQFKTELRVTKEQLPNAIKSVVSDFYDKYENRIKLSIIVQEFIEPDLAGVTFTRNPNGSGELLIEYIEGHGEQLVSGEITPQQIKVRSNTKFNSHKLPNLQDAILSFQKIEKHFGFPQDIEWCVKNGTWYFLQSRPITSVTKEYFDFLKYIEKELSKEQKFYYKKDKITEAVPRPTTIMKELLQKIYSDIGPVSRVYKRFGIQYSDTNFLKILGNELFIDAERELQSMLPAFIYTDELKERMCFNKGILKSLKNIFKISAININQKKIDLLKKELVEYNNQKAKNLNFEEQLKSFLENYEIIFEINFLATLSLKKLEQIIKNENIELNECLSSTGINLLEEFQPNIEEDNSSLLGNSVDLFDLSKFQRPVINSIQEPFTNFNTISDFKKPLVQSYAKLTKQVMDLREIARWYTVKITSKLRNCLFEIARKNSFKNETNILFSTISEVSENPSESIFIKRRLEYETFNKFSLPIVVCSTNYSIDQKSEIKVIVEGSAEGIVSKPSDLHKTEKNILLVQSLTPNLTQYLDQINGIICEHGGTLSHMAIIARENNIPVISMPSDESKKILGKRIQINTKKDNLIQNIKEYSSIIEDLQH